MHVLQEEVAALIMALRNGAASDAQLQQLQHRFFTAAAAAPEVAFGPGQLDELADALATQTPDSPGMSSGMLLLLNCIGPAKCAPARREVAQHKAAIR
jgi:hypothetical protein